MREYEALLRDIAKVPVVALRVLALACFIEQAELAYLSARAGPISDVSLVGHIRRACVIVDPRAFFLKLPEPSRVELAEFEGLCPSLMPVRAFEARQELAISHVTLLRSTRAIMVRLRLRRGTA